MTLDEGTEHEHCICFIYLCTSYFLKYGIGAWRFGARFRLGRGCVKDTYIWVFWQLAGRAQIPRQHLFICRYEMHNEVLFSQRGLDRVFGLDHQC
jgi:hypothetical protein